eukprot:1157126-Pelagomonas_calceolata.AAC.9
MQAGVAVHAGMHAEQQSSCQAGLPAQACTQSSRAHARQNYLSRCMSMHMLTSSCLRRHACRAAGLMPGRMSCSCADAPVWGRCTNQRQMHTS